MYLAHVRIGAMGSMMLIDWTICDLNVRKLLHIYEMIISNLV